MAINWIEKEILVNSFSIGSAKFKKFDAGNMILFQIKFFGSKDTTLARYFIKVTACPSYMRLRVIR